MLQTSPLSVGPGQEHYARAIWTLFLLILGACNLGIQIKDLYTYVWKNLNFLYIMIKGHKSREISIMKP